MLKKTKKKQRQIVIIKDIIMLIETYFGQYGQELISGGGEKTFSFFKLGNTVLERVIRKQRNKSNLGEIAEVTNQRLL